MLSESVAYFARARRNAVACIDLKSNSRLTYPAFAQRAARMARVLGQLCAPRVTRGLRVAVISRNSTDFLCLVVACRGISAILVPFNWRLSAPETLVLAEMSDPHVVLFEEEFAANVAGFMRIAPRAVFLSLGEKGEFEREVAREPGVVAELCSGAPEDVVTLLFTSGTTGRPKAVIVTERNAAASARNFALSVDVNGQTAFLSHMPMFHVAGLFTVASTVLQAGGTALVSPQFSVDETLAAVANEQLAISHCFCVPQMTDRLRAAPAFDPKFFRKLRVLQTGGAPHPRAAIRAWVDDGVHCADGYGMSEAGTVLGMPPDDLLLLAQKAGSAGIPAVGMEVDLRDPDGEPVAEGEVGELWLRGPSVTPGYWRNAEATKAAIVDGWLRTGDAARRDGDGFFTLVDRFKDMYISGGENVYPAEVEAALLETGEIAEAAVIGIPDAKWGEVGVAFVVPAATSTASDTRLLERCRERLASYKLPREFRRVTELPRTASGKVRKDLLRAGNPTKS